jgi:hypothetical protein
LNQSRCTDEQPPGILVLPELRGSWGRETKMRGRVTGGGHFLSSLVHEPPPSLRRYEPI